MKSVYVGLSGGVDSAVSAALLKERGFDVSGVFIKIWQPEFIECTWERDRIDAMRVAAALDIPFREIDLSDEYLRAVVREMTSAYERGYTPNPDVFCNERIKFGAFAQWSLSQGADGIATGHYARIEVRAGEHQLLRGTDAAKDQSYFLYRMPREYLPRVLFPVGSLTKPEVRAIAAKLSLPVAHKHDSQGLCFVGDIDMRDFLRRYISVQDGDVLDEAGRVVGTHQGAALYTRGQRHGFNVRASKEPQYVISSDIGANTITVSPHKSACETADAPLRDMHWLTDVSLPIRADVQARYRESPIAATIESSRVRFFAPHVASPGQDLVIFDGERVLGGGRLA